MPTKIQFKPYGNVQYKHLFAINEVNGSNKIKYLSNQIELDT